MLNQLRTGCGGGAAAAAAMLIEGAAAAPASPQNEDNGRTSTRTRTSEGGASTSPDGGTGAGRTSDVRKQLNLFSLHPNAYLFPGINLKVSALFGRVIPVGEDLTPEEEEIPLFALKELNLSEQARFLTVLGQASPIITQSKPPVRPWCRNPKYLARNISQYTWASVPGRTRLEVVGHCKSAKFGNFVLYRCVNENDGHGVLAEIERFNDDHHVRKESAPERVLREEYFSMSPEAAREPVTPAPVRRPRSRKMNGPPVAPFQFPMLEGAPLVFVERLGLLDKEFPPKGSEDEKFAFYLLWLLQNPEGLPAHEIAPNCRVAHLVRPYFVPVAFEHGTAHALVIGIPAKGGPANGDLLVQLMKLFRVPGSAHNISWELNTLQDFVNMLVSGRAGDCQFECLGRYDARDGKLRQPVQLFALRKEILAIGRWECIESAGIPASSEAATFKVGKELLQVSIPERTHFELRGPAPELVISAFGDGLPRYVDIRKCGIGLYEPLEETAAGAPSEALGREMTPESGEWRGEENDDDESPDEGRIHRTAPAKKRSISEMMGSTAEPTYLEGDLAHSQPRKRRHTDGPYVAPEGEHDTLAASMRDLGDFSDDGDGEERFRSGAADVMAKAVARNSTCVRNAETGLHSYSVGNLRVDTFAFPATEALSSPLDSTDTGVLFDFTDKLATNVNV